MFIVFTKPNKLTKTYQEAIEIANVHYYLTGEVVAIERSEITDVNASYSPS
tara:strand:+ start:303 stop:455 length:153 start_codon:yes stop_codon:yes gene_type:complete